MLCPQPCTQMPPPPWEPSVMLRPSMLDGLHQKLLGNGLAPLGPVVQLAVLSSVVAAGNAAASKPSFQGYAPWKSTPFASTVMPAPSYAPIRVGSFNCSARLPLRVASQPTVASSGKRSTENCMSAGHVYVPDGSYALVSLIGVPLSARPKRQTTCRRHGSSLAIPAGWVPALMMLEAAPTPCSRTGFHISNSSL